jgi:enamine deaminase RidA (YjgF/YER057c/UK114 family)
MIIESKLEKLGLQLPEAAPPAANYEPFQRIGNLLFVSGQLPTVNGELKYPGQLGAELDAKAGYKAAVLCALNGLAQIKQALGSFDALETIVRIEGFVNSAPGWSEQSTVINGCSDLLRKVLGPKAGHARIAVGCSALPLNAAVEIAFLVATKRSE